jgi:hypothetical protein
MIFVDIASYRDPECAATVRDLFGKARYPNWIIVCVVLQTEPADNVLFCGKNIRAVLVKATDSKGVCWARSMGYKFRDGEDYVLQVDSHMRFAEQSIGSKHASAVGVVWVVETTADDLSADV